MFNLFLNNKTNRFALEFLQDFEPMRYGYYENLSEPERKEIDNLIIKYYNYGIHQLKQTLNIPYYKDNAVCNLKLGMIFDAVILRAWNWTDEKVNFQNKKVVIAKVLQHSINQYCILISQAQSVLEKKEVDLKIIEYVENEFKSGIDKYYGEIDERLNPVEYDTTSQLTVEYNTRLSLRNKWENLCTKLFCLMEEFDWFKNTTILLLLLIIVILCLKKADFLSLLFIYIPLSIFFKYFFKIDNKLKNLKSKADTLYKLEDKSEYERLGVDLICVQCAENNIGFFDPDVDNEALPVVSDVRLEITDNIGFVLPDVRIMDNTNLDNEVRFLIRSQEVLKVPFYPKKLVVKKEVLENNNIKLPQYSTFCKNEKYGDVYWVSPKFIQNKNISDFLTPSEYFRELLSQICYEYVEQIFSLENVLYIQQLLLSESQTRYDELLDKFTMYEQKEVFVQILKKGGGLKDLCYVVDRMIYYVRQTKDLEHIAYLVVQDLKFGK